MRTLYYDILSALGIIIGKRPLCGPRVSQLNISDECNLDCIMCNRSLMPVGGFMPYREAARIVKELYSIGLREIYFHGYGEPFLHPRILDLFDLVHQTYPRLRQFVVTNGCYLTPSTVASLIANKVGVRVSLHAGDPQTWQAINPKRPLQTFSKIEQGVTLLAREGAPIEVLYVVTRANYRSVEGLFHFALRTGLKNILFRPMRLYKDPDGHFMNQHLLLSREQHEWVQAKLTALKNRFIMRLHVNLAPFDMSCYADRMGRPSSFDFYKQNVCLLGWVFSLILKDGTVLGCLEESFDHPMGNALKQPFKEIWWSENYQRFRNQQLFNDIHHFDKDGCLTWCQHLRMNQRLNLVRQRKWLSLLQTYLKNARGYRR